MEAWLDPGGSRFALLLLLSAGVGFFFASRAAADALFHNPHGQPIHLAVGHWLSIACVCIFAILAGRTEIALCVILATSVACLTLVLGIMAYVAPMTAPPGEGRALWPFVLPAAVLALVSGLSGKITVVHAGAMLLLGGVLVPLVTHRSAEPRSTLPPNAARGPAQRIASSAQLAVALVLAGLAAWAAVHGAQQLHGQSRVFNASLIASALIGPSLVIPILSSSSLMAHRGQSTQAITLYTQIVLLNLCLLLPMVALLWYIRPWLIGGMASYSDLATNLNPPIIYPLLVWRLDTLVLVVLGVMLVPVWTGRWMLGRYEGIGLMIGYGMYLMLTVVMNVR